MLNQQACRYPFFYLSKGIIEWLGKQRNERKYLQNIYLPYIHIKNYGSNWRQTTDCIWPPLEGGKFEGWPSVPGTPHGRWSSTWCKERPILEAALENKAHCVLFLTSGNWNLLHFVVTGAGWSAWTAAFRIVTTLCSFEAVLGVDGRAWLLVKWGAFSSWDLENSSMLFVCSLVAYKSYR